jgi:hypothetical protein
MRCVLHTHVKLFIIKKNLLRKFLAWSFVKCIAFDASIFQVQKSLLN